jgi:sugar transferase EpsL
VNRAAREPNNSGPARGLSYDRVVAALALFVLSPLLASLALLIRLLLGRPVLFRQLRPGLHGRPFAMYKFRTMIVEEEHGQAALSDEERLIKLGALLRRTSLDELPELWNVLRGDMRLVGPRPLLVEYLPLYTREQLRRHEVPPGITGWAQVNGRNSLSWEEKFALDTWYVDHRSFWLDMRILAMTLRRVVRSEGINQQGRATMDRFTGTLPEPCADERSSPPPGRRAGRI